VDSCSWDGIDDMLTPLHMETNTEDQYDTCLAAYEMELGCPACPVGDASNDARRAFIDFRAFIISKFSAEHVCDGITGRDAAVSWKDRPWRISPIDSASETIVFKVFSFNR